MAEMLAHRADEGILSLVADERWRYIDPGASAHGVCVGIEFVEESGQASTQRLALIEDESQGQCQRSRSDQ